MSLFPNIVAHLVSLVMRWYSRQLEAKTRHTALILVNRARAVGLRVFSVAEEHAFVARGFLVFADAAGLSDHQSCSLEKYLNVGENTFGAAAAAWVVAGLSAELADGATFIS